MSCNISISSCSQDNGIGVVNLLVSTLLQAMARSQNDLSSSKIWPDDYGHTPGAFDLNTYDFIVIGSGSAGSVVASRLSENASVKVLLLEEGGDPPVESTVPNTLASLQTLPYSYNISTQYTATSCKGYINNVCRVLFGKMIGGTGSMNGMIYVRGAQDDYDTWKKMGNPSWGWDEVYPFFEKSIQNNLSSPLGGLSVNEFQDVSTPLNSLIFDAAEAIGLRYRHSIFNGVRSGYMVLPGQIQNGERVSSARGYLSTARNRPNLYVIKNAQVTKMIFDTSTLTATGVEFVYQSKRKVIARASKEIILSAGAVGSPKLLMLSGIGPKEHLKQKGIPILKDLSVGDNLQDHHLLPLYFKLRPGLLPPIKNTDGLDATYNYLIHRRGTLGKPIDSTVTLFLNTQNPWEPPQIQVQHIFIQAGTLDNESLVFGLPVKGKIIQNVLKESARNDIFVLPVSLVRSMTKGTIRLSSSNPSDLPLMTFNYAGEEEEQKTLIRGVRKQLEYMSTYPYVKWGAEFIRLNLTDCDRLKYQSNNYWKCYLQHMATSYFHLVGSVRMGPASDPTAVLDWNLKVKGIKGLRVADASIMPRTVRSNTNAATIMIAEKASDFIRREWQL